MKKNFPLINKQALAQARGNNRIFITAKYGNDISFQIFDESAGENIIVWDSINIAGLKDKSDDKIISHVRSVYFQL